MDYESTLVLVNQQLETLANEARLSAEDRASSIFCLNAKYFALMAYVLALKLNFRLVKASAKADVASVFVDSAKTALMGPLKRPGKKARGLSIQQLSDRSSLSPSNIHNWFSLTKFGRDGKGVNMAQFARLYGPQQLLVIAEKDESAPAVSLTQLPFQRRSGRRVWPTNMQRPDWQDAFLLIILDALGLNDRPKSIANDTAWAAFEAAIRKLADGETAAAAKIKIAARKAVQAGDTDLAFAAATLLDQLIPGKTETES